MFEPIFENVRQKSPLVHNITNYVTVNDCANMLLACGASPIMADDPEDAVEITAICGGLNINIGTLNQRTIPAMLAAGKRAKWVHFWGHAPEKDGRITETCLSQWWMAEFRVEAQPYCCMEQYMMAEKARLFGDEETLEKILEATVQGKIKALGREVKNFDQTEWDKCKHTIVLTGNFQKFLQNPELKDFLLRTGDKILVEASPRDRIWGIGMGKANENAENPAAWRGRNLLGFALMEVRDELRRVCANEDKIDWSL